MKKTPKIIFVIGGLFSGIGKGIVACSIGKLLKNNNLTVSMQKHDPYLNVDCGLMNPSEHGEVFITEQGLETDLDIGNYERFLGNRMTNLSSVTSGKIYSEILEKERKGLYRGKTINIYNVVNAIKQKIINIIETEKNDFLVIELGGTIGDNDLQPFLMAAVDIKRKYGAENVGFVFVTYVSYFEHLKQFKTKLVQSSIQNLRLANIDPDFVILRSKLEIPNHILEKISLHSYIPNIHLFPLPNKDIYEIPLSLVENNFFKKLTQKFKLKNNLDLKLIEKFADNANKLKNTTKTIKIGIINKYPHFKESYLSLYHALYAAGLKTNIGFKYVEINPELLTKQNVSKYLKDLDGVLVPGGFGERGSQGKIIAIEYARVNKVPFLGICFGMQLALIEYGQNVLNISHPTSEEFIKKTDDNNLIINYFDSINHEMFMGSKEVMLKLHSKVQKIIEKDSINERHRNRLIFNNQYRDQFEDGNLVFSGIFHHPKQDIMEIFELTDNPFFVGTQFHGEWNSYPEKPKPLFVSYFKNCLNFQEKK